MQIFKVKLTESAIRDLIGITEYLNNFSAETALRYYDLIHEKANSLGILPTGYSLVRDDRLRKLGIRWAYVRNYTLYFTVDEKNHIVFVENILYSRRAYDVIL